MTTIIASYTVIPSEATPKRRLSMSESDDVVRWTHATTIYIYKGNHNDKNFIIKSLSDSLSKILVHYYPLAGRLNWIGGGRVELECNAKGALLLEAESTKTLAEYGHFSPNEPIDELIPIVDYTQPIEEIPLLLVQLTRFQGGKEGLAIGVSISHPLVDGVAAISFFNSWAKLCRGESLDPHEISPFLDRTIFKSQYPPSSPLFDHQEFKTPPLILGKSDAIEEKSKQTAVALLRLTSEQVEKLKKKTNDHSLKEGFRSYSRFEVIVAHVWRTLCMARQLDDQQQSVVRILVDIRRRLDPPLPNGVVEHLFKPRRLGALIGFLENKDNDDVQMVAAGLLANLPKSERKITMKLIKLSGLDEIMSILKIGKMEAKENALSALFRFTNPTNIESQCDLAKRGIYPLLVDSLNSGSITAKARAAAIIGDLSMSTPKLTVISKPTSCSFFKSSRVPLCSAHGSICSVSSIFCLLEANSFPGLIKLLHGEVHATTYEVIQTLSTLVLEDFPQRGAHVLHESNAMRPLLDILNWGTDSLKAEPVGLLENMFVSKEIVEYYGTTARSCQIGLLGMNIYGDGHLRKIAAKVLSLLEHLNTVTLVFAC
ncbi:hypothetical protein VNO77_33963 [Canavalia gladiata]|uniref:Uncharacterized protein n=1 Tax=Canavalia gladiata TaxID=3824 RepID=A0AAN9KDI9_CANGL